MGGFTRVVLSFASVLVLSTNLLAAGKTTTSGSTSITTAKPAVEEQWKTRLEQVDLSACEQFLSGEVLTRYDLMGREWGLADLLNPNPAVNLAVQFPTMLMNSDQKMYFTAVYHGKRTIRDPAYRSKDLPYYPMISGGVKETKGRMIVGHYETVAAAVDYLSARATGQRASKMVGFNGPAGTGKTQLLMLLNNASAALAMSDPSYYQMTFDFVGFSEIPELRPLSRVGGGVEGSSAMKDITLNRSPLVLLPTSLQKRVIDLAKGPFVKKFGIQPIPFLVPSVKTQRVIDAIVRYYKNKENKTTITEEDYIRYISAHVRLVRRAFETNQPAAIVRAIEKNTDVAPLFFVEDLALSQIYGPVDPLSYRYGTIMKFDGGGVSFDEFFRDPESFRNSLLDLAENGVLSYGAAPPEYSDTTVMFATNDSSIAKAQDVGEAAAHLDRTRRLPMRHAIEPWHAVKIAMSDIGPSQFVMRELGQASELAPVSDLPGLDLNIAFPDSSDGQPVGTDGRYAVYFYPDREKPPILIAPRTLLMMGLTASATRMVFDQKVIDKINQSGHPLHTYSKFRAAFIDPTERLRILLGLVQPSSPVAQELYRFRDVAHEGENGLGAREIELWFSTALAAASRRGVPLTPMLMAKVFSDAMDKGFVVSPKDKPMWNALADLVKADFLLPAISADVVGILQGQGRPESMYDDVRKELLALRTDKNEDRIYGEGNIGVPIDKRRLNEIFKIYRELNGADFDPGLLSDFHAQVSEQASTRRHPKLLEAIQRYLMRTEMDRTTISGLVDYFDNKPVSDEVRVRAAQAETQFERYGYDRTSFRQALLFVRDLEHVVRDQIQK